ncbi:MAG: pyruvate dehydrogenase (acetyl-transferring) E1 component subunit alpha [Chloroflexi bacterium]|nr:pyruvate dehydrogenase (acetyl-transferring) E1 component subunit alpha [Chloroflexota bacterium]
MQLKEDLSKTDMVHLYRQMHLVRVFEEKCAEAYMLGKIRGFLHLYIGEEAIAVGVAAALQPQDYVVTHYRDHGHALARGLDPRRVMAELYGRATGLSHGKGGSMHLFDVNKNFMGGYAIVGGQLPIATGLALASQYLDEKRVVVAFFGDGALNEGEFHEAMNLASLWKLPVLFFLENNLYGMGTHIDRTYAGGRDVYKAGDHYRVPARHIDGMDVLAVRQATREALERIRHWEGPFLLEALTYRFRGHSMADPVEYRDKTEEARWHARDPIPTFRKYLTETAHISEEQLEQVDVEVEQEVEEAARFADESPEPGPSALWEDISAT